VLDLSLDGPALTAALVDVPSVSGTERELADEVEATLRDLPHLEVVRDGDAVLARTAFGRDRRVALAGHLDTVPIAGNLPSYRDGDLLYGCGTSDMKAGDAVMLRLAAGLTDPAYDLTYLFYDCEEVEADRNGLTRIARTRPDWLRADLAVLLEPTNALIEGGCQGTLRVRVRIPGRRAHSARSWMGLNAIHQATPVLATLAAYPAREVVIDGCDYHEGLNAVGISGGIAGNVIPDECVLDVNYRFAPDRSLDQALDHVRGVFEGYDVEFADGAPGALPRLTEPAALDLVSAVGSTPKGKLGWTDVSRFAAAGIAAVNYGPGDPNLAHSREERVDVRQIVEVEQRLGAYLRGAAG
jgi:succinyl-diaminopimelate desuccinylase